MSQEEYKTESLIRKNALSLNVLGTVAGVGITYERAVSDKFSVEAGLGLFGGGLGFKYYFSDMRIQKILFNTGFTIAGSPFFTSSEVGIGGHGFLIYLPVGFSFYGKGKLNLGIDIGPGTTFVNSSSRSMIIIYGNFKIGFRF